MFPNEWKTVKNQACHTYAWHLYIWYDTGTYRYCSVYLAQNHRTTERLNEIICTISRHCAFKDCVHCTVPTFYCTICVRLSLVKLRKRVFFFDTPACRILWWNGDNSNSNSNKNNSNTTTTAPATTAALQQQQHQQHQYNNNSTSNINTITRAPAPATSIQ